MATQRHPVDALYLEWLAQQIRKPWGLDKSYYDLFGRLHDTEFTWTVLGDDNRAQDGQDLRFVFVEEAHKDFYEKNFVRFTSLLEVMVALSRRLEFLAGGSAPDWAWRLMENLRLNHLYDPLQGARLARYNEIVEALIWRTYQPDGTGGFFPLNNPQEDQTKVEIWYQMNAYVSEIQEP